ncbi:MAG: hypothetical protein JWN88_1030, partial [Frankiales bacterium]|nr:hypothetical protein [Frankiales bacterium]
MAPHDDAGSAGLAQATPSAAAEQGQGGPSGTARDVVVLRLPAAGAYLSVLR